MLVLRTIPQTREGSLIITIIFDRKKSWVYLKHNVLRDACLVDKNFYDDYFVQSPETDKKKSRPFSCFESPDHEWLFLLPHTNKKVKDSWHYRRYVTELNDCRPNVEDGKYKKWSADFSRSFRIPREKWETYVHKHSDANLLDEEWTALNLRMNRHVVECDRNKANWNRKKNFPWVDFLDLHLKVETYWKALYLVLPRKVKNMNVNVEDFAALLKNHQSLLIRLDEVYTDFVISTKNWKQKSHDDMRRSALNSARNMVESAVKIAGSLSGFYSNRLVDDYSRAQASLKRVCDDLKKVADQCKGMFVSKT